MWSMALSTSAQKRAASCGEISRYCPSNTCLRLSAINSRKLRSRPWKLVAVDWMTLDLDGRLGFIHDLLGWDEPGPFVALLAALDLQALAPVWAVVARCGFFQGGRFG